MIIGVGTDLVDIRRIERTMSRFGKTFCNRIYTPEEQALCDSREGKKRMSAYAMRFAAKEACSKALGTGLRQGVFWRDMAVSFTERKTGHDIDRWCFKTTEFLGAGGNYTPN